MLKAATQTWNQNLAALNTKTLFATVLDVQKLLETRALNQALENTGLFLGRVWLQNTISRPRETANWTPFTCIVEMRCCHQSCCSLRWR